MTFLNFSKDNYKGEQNYKLILNLSTPRSLFLVALKEGKILKGQLLKLMIAQQCLNIRIKQQIKLTLLR